ncbi:MAG: DNA primase [Candidatus Tokpelaia sp. JSC161]|jgi:DNA primase|nr:MAG: DNA primase [Candidatus Tokpelaia sp. JSC161]
MNFSSHFLKDIRSRVAISALIKNRVIFDRKKSKSSSGDFWALCPFHIEKTASFHCNDHNGIYHCFGCGAHGDHFTFLMRIDGISFHQAVERIAQIGGIIIENSDVSIEKRETERASLYIMELATQFFEQLLQNEKNSHARNYLSQRIPLNLQKMFRIGYAPEKPQKLTNFLLEKGITSSQLKASGLFIEIDRDKITLPFRNRILFPIENIKGKVIGFGGRAITSNIHPKYLNSQKSDLFQKGQILYNLARAKRAFSIEKTTQPLLVVEGYMDVISLTSAGFKVVAPLGTALTKEQMNLLLSNFHNPVLCFDGDNAGANAAFQAIDRALPLLKSTTSLHFVVLPNGKDPDDIIREGGHQMFHQLLKQAIPLSEMLWRRETDGKVFNTPESRASLENSLRSAVMTIHNHQLRHYYLQEIKERIHTLFHSSFPSFFRKYKKNENDIIPVSESLLQSKLVTKQDNVLFPRETAILAILINHPELWNENFEVLSMLEFRNQELIDLHRSILDILAKKHPENATTMLQLLNKKTVIIKRIMQFIHDIGMRSALPSAPIQYARESLKQAIYLHLRTYHLDRQLHEIETELISNPDGSILATFNDIKNEVERTKATEA